MRQSKNDTKSTVKKTVVDEPVVDKPLSFPDWDSETTVYDKKSFDEARKSEASSGAKKTTKAATPKTAAAKKTTTTKKTAESSAAAAGTAKKTTAAKKPAESSAAAAGTAKKTTTAKKTAESSAAAAGTVKKAPTPRKTADSPAEITEVPRKKQPASRSATHAASKSASETETPTLSRRNRNASSGAHKASGTGANATPKKKHKKKRKHPILRALALLILCGVLIGGGAAFYFVYSVISETPPIDPSNINEMLNVTTVMYDANGNEMDSIFSGSNREIASVQDMPKHLTDAFIALEDKTFRTHHGFNFTRIVGAVLESVFGGGRISGTSTITQQLARNVFLQDTQFDYSIKRKIAEAYYSLKIEKALSKDEIIEAYLNTIYFGYGSWGIETAAQSYFKKSVSELTLAESAALAALPQLPNEYQFVNFIEGGTAAQYADIAIKETPDGVYVVNDLSRERRRACLMLMLEQELITQEEYDSAINIELKDMLNPDFSTQNLGFTSYFADYAISEVIEDLQKEKGLDYDSAWRMIYQGGLSIYSTMIPEAQNAIATEFSNPDNYPGVNPIFDGNGNAVNSDGVVLMFAYDNLFDESGNHIISADDYDRLADGTMIIYYGRNLHIYETYVGENVEYSLEFPAMYDYDENWAYYTISGGYINIPMNYKTSNSDGDLIISADFFTDYPDFFIFNEDGSCTVPPSSYSLGQKTVQPQSAMTIIENKTGNIIAMVGGRSASGRQIYNRAIAPRQSGSSIKPLAVYSAALQQSVEEMRSGKTHEFVNYGIDKQGAKYYGSYLTPASIVIDEKLTINGEAWPKNASGTFTGQKTMRQALMDSINTCAVKIWMQVGADYSLQNVKKFGITTLIEEGAVNDVNPAALALGGQSEGVTTLEMASAYTVFPNNGVRYEPSSYTRVLDRHGNEILTNNPEPQEVLDPGVAWIMTDMLRGVVTGGTGTYANFDTFVAGKTGTTDNEYDIWFDGFTNNYTASLWIGSDINAKLGSMSEMAAALWGRIMSQLEGSYLGERAPMPDDVIKYNGEYFVDGTQKGAPTKTDLTKTVSICKETGLLATPLCKDVEKKEFSTIDDEDEIKELPEEYCYLHNDDPEKYPTTEEGMKHIEEEKKKKEEEEKKKAEEEAAKKAEEEAKKAEEEAKKAAEEEARRKEEERKAACEKWLSERESHRLKYTAEDYAAYQAANGGANPPWNVDDLKEPAEYEEGYRDGDMACP